MDKLADEIRLQARILIIRECWNAVEAIRKRWEKRSKLIEQLGNKAGNKPVHAK